MIPAHASTMSSGYAPRNSGSRNQRLCRPSTQLVDELVVEVEACSVDAAPAVRQHSRPGDREAERVEAQLAHQRHVLAVAVVEVAGDGAVVAVADFSGGRAEAIPDALAATVLVRRTFDLIRRGRGAPDEVSWERLCELARHGGPLG